MVPPRRRRPPAPTCALCDRSVEEVGGIRITWSGQAGVVSRSSDRPIGRVPRSALLFPLPRPHSGELLLWPPDEGALGRAVTQWLARFRPWVCQTCAGRTCDRCGSPTIAPYGCDTLGGDGRSGHYPILPGPAGCIREGCSG